MQNPVAMKQILKTGIPLSLGSLAREIEVCLFLVQYSSVVVFQAGLIIGFVFDIGWRIGDFCEYNGSSRSCRLDYRANTFR